jgi:hypothetical protein
MSNYYLRYCIVGQDNEFSFAPVDLGETGFILCDGLYDFADTPYSEEMCRLAMPQVFVQYKRSAYGEYWNPATKLLVEFQPGEEGYQPEPLADPVKIADQEIKTRSYCGYCGEDTFTFEDTDRNLDAALFCVECANPVQRNSTTLPAGHKPNMHSLAGCGFNLEKAAKFAGINSPAVLVTDQEGYWSVNTLVDVLQFDDCQTKLYKLVEIDINEAKEFFEC